jgi:predicted Fe-Mo cluster-binding NifX family protein
MVMKTAFSIWKHRIAPVFDTAQQLCVVESAGGKIKAESTHELAGSDLAKKTDWLLQQGVSTLVCGAVSRLHQEKLVVAGIKVVPFVAGDIRQVMQAYFDGTLKHAVFKMPGCCGQLRRTCAGRCRTH